MEFIRGKRNRNEIHTLRSAAWTYARRGAAAVLALLLTVSGFPAGAFAPGTAAGQIFSAGQAYAAERVVKAVTYMGSEWTVNFWDSELSTMEQDFRQIRKDGFNTVIIAVPWRQFQPDLNAGDLNPEAYLRLRRIMAAGEETGLQVMLRLGYTWDNFDRVRDVSDRYRRLRTDPKARERWLGFAKSVYGTASSFGSFGGGFLTWEDFWGFMKETETAGTRMGRAAVSSGYRDWLKENIPAEEIALYYGGEAEKATGSDAVFPGSESPARRFVYAWNDAWMNSLLEDTQEVFPGLSMEVRLDIDPVPNLYGYQDGCVHNVTFPAGKASYTCCMYSAAMGYPAGTLVSADQGIGKAWEILGELQNDAGKPVFIDQFLFTDNTPEFSHNAKLREDEIPEYITGMASVIREAGKGYAVWTYRDYADNVICNGQFAQGRKGWRLYGGEIVTENGNSMLFLQKGDAAEQNLANQFTVLPDEDYVDFRAEPVSVAAQGTPDGQETSAAQGVPAGQGTAVTQEAPDGNAAADSVLLEISTGSAVKQIRVDQAGLFRVSMEKSNSTELMVRCLEGNVRIDDVKVYSFVTEGGIYHMDGTPGPYLEAVRTLNRLLEE